MGDAVGVTEQLPDVIGALLPLLELVESQLHCGIPIEALKTYKPGTLPGDGAAEKT
jgi:hypothetical protein